MTVYENALVAAAFGAGLRGRTGQSSRRATQWSARHSAIGDLLPIDLTLSAAQAARTRSSHRDRTAFAPARRSCRRADRRRNGEVDRIGNAINASGVTVIWIEHLVHALVSVARRPDCSGGRTVIADGVPNTCCRTERCVRSISALKSSGGGRACCALKVCAPVTACSRRCSTSAFASALRKSWRSSDRTALENRRCFVRSWDRCGSARAASGLTILRSAVNPSGANCSRGVVLVPEGRRLFPSLSVLENLKLAARNGRRGQWTVERLFDELSVLRPLSKRPATSLSGGQQQLVAVGRALVANPSYLLCDEVSLGLSPLAVTDVYALLKKERARVERPSWWSSRM